MKKKLLYGILIAVIAVGVYFNGQAEGVGSEVTTGLVIVAVMAFCMYMKKVTKREEAEKKAAQAEFANMQMITDDAGATLETPQEATTKAEDALQQTETKTNE